jgi:lysophospholipase L1-like esterase
MKRKIYFVLLAFLLPAFCMAGKRVLFIGDSITDGAWGGSGGGAKPSSQRNQWDINHIYGHGYMYICAAYYQGEYPAMDYEFFNRGISGNTLADLEKRWQDDALNVKPDLMSILIGTNDVNKFLCKAKHGSFDFKNWEARYRKLLDRSLAANPNLKLVLCAPFTAKTGKMRNSTNFDERQEIITHLAEIVKQIAKDYHAIYLPYNTMFEQLIKHTPNASNTYWIWDGIHPTAAGHERMATMWIKAVNKKKYLK